MKSRKLGRRLLVLPLIAGALVLPANAMASDPVIGVGGGTFTIIETYGDMECVTTISNSGTRVRCTNR